MSDTDLRLRGQEVEIRVTQAGSVLQSVTAVSTFDDTVETETSQQGFLGEMSDRYDDILHGYSWNLEFQINRATWVQLQRAITDRAQRKTPDMIFNIIRTDFYSNGDSLVLTYKDVKFGPQNTSVASRVDFVKVKLTGKCSERKEQVNALP